FSVSGDTRIFTRYGYESIGDLRHMAQGRLRHCIHGGTVAEFPFRSRVATAGGLSAPSALVAEGYRSLLEITTNNGLKAKVTPEHQLLSVKGCQEHWVKARDLQIGDWVVIRTPHRVWPKNFVELEKPKLKTIPPGGFRRKSEKVPRVLDEDTAWLTGYLIGDGCLPSDGRPAVHLCVTDELSPRLRQTVQEKFGIPLKIKPHSLTSRIKHGWIGSQAAYEFFVQSLGVNPRDKLHVPEAVVRSPKAVIKAFLRGLWAADGYVKGRVNYLTTISSSLARDVADLILMLGSLPYIHAAKRESTKCGKIYRVGYVRQDRIPTEKALYQSSKSGRWHWRTPRQPKCFLGVRRSTLERSGLHHPLNKPGYYYLRVASIKPLKPEPVYDLKVPDEECFVGNGFIFHNCGGRSSPMLRRVRLRPTESVIAEMRHMFETGRGAHESH
ncbi:MAG: LAGLIDADG family homing endonuclease, partial [Acidobacteriota bacterium]